MKQLSKLTSYLFHPIFIPLIGTLIYFFVSPKYLPDEIRAGMLFSILILTVAIPIITYLLLKSMGLVSDIFISNVNQRKVPIGVNLILIYIVLNQIIPVSYTLELYYFFVGLLGAYLASLILAFFKTKISLHILGLSNILMFLIGLSIHFEVNMTLIIGTFVLILGSVASARLYLKAHNTTELLIAFFIGATLQLVTFTYWL